MNSKLAICEAERLERLQQIRQDVRRLSEARARVRGLVAADDVLRQTLASASRTDVASGLSDEGHDLAKQFQKLILENYGDDDRECSEQVCEHSSTPDSVYSSLSDVDANNECHLKIIKVTNVYKVAYLKHFIKQKRLRRATRQAIFKKKMESIKKMLEEWQKALNTVITRKLSTLNLDEHFMDTTSQEAMGDYSKQNFREDSCSDSDLRTDIGDSCYDDYSSTWVHNPYMTFPCEYESIPEMSTPKEYNYFEDVPCRISQQQMNRDVSSSKGPHTLFVLPEETSSQIAFEEFRRENEEAEEYAA
ncbi:hypothetical protein EVAR_90335_1 [Eumeta japonica]|uniref:Uncharacterized protein n=1 Tax=Eumeta variegata TaxID=151549 RepID=A0A4C1YG81_EUMVA|nr:hypothetical protein EVAR_90335_1 [Eumeta japonica]